MIDEKIHLELLRCIGFSLVQNTKLKDSSL